MGKVELNGLQKLAVAEALMKSLKPLVDTKGGKAGAENLRTQADDKLRELYSETGADRLKIKINDVEVGSLSLAFKKAVTTQKLDCVDMPEFIEWLRTSDEGIDTLNAALVDYKTLTAVLAAAQNIGFLPNGCEVKTHDVPEHINGSRLMVKPEKVAEALADGLPQAVTGLIAGDVE